MAFYLRFSLICFVIFLAACSSTQQSATTTKLPDPTVAVLATATVAPTSMATSAPVPIEVQKLTISSPAFAEGAAIPERYSCHGADVSPALSWSSLPESSKTVVVIVEDPDANNYTHWVAYNIPANMPGLPEGIPHGWKLVEGGWQGQNAFTKPGYNGPCPPPAKEHHYVFHVYAVDTVLDIEPSDLSPVGKGSVRDAIKGHILAEGSLTGVYTTK